MARSRFRRSVLTFLLACCVTASVARGGLIKDSVVGLGLVGFDLQGNRNPLSSGVDLLLTQSFVGNPFDFGPWDMTFQGPISLAVSTGGRALPGLDVSFTTAVNSLAAPSPLSYALNYDVGVQSGRVSGSVFIDGDFSINKFGYYDLSFVYSSRQNVEREGRFANDTTANDFDLEPINISGNIYADILGAITQPLFDRVGRENVFIQFSGRSKLIDVFRASVEEVVRNLAAGFGDDLGLALVQKRAGLSGKVFDIAPGFDVTDPPGLRVGDPPGPRIGLTANGAVVPEPTVLLLMLAGLPALIARPIRRRRLAA